MKAIRFSVTELGAASRVTQGINGTEVTDPGVGDPSNGEPCFNLICRVVAAD